MEQLIKFCGFLWQSCALFAYAKLQLDSEKLMAYFPTEKLPDFIQKVLNVSLPDDCCRGQNFVCICALVRLFNLQEAFLEQQEKHH